VKNFAFALAIGLSMAALISSASAQEYMQKSWAVQNGDTTIIFAPANGKDLNVPELQAFSQLADSQPQMARALAKNPSLIASDTFVARYPELQQFLAQYPGAREHFMADPGNFVVPGTRPE